MARLEFGRRTSQANVRWIEADLRHADWFRAVPEPLDAIVSATALHWLDPSHLEGLARGAAAVLRPGGVFADYDTMRLDARTPRLRALSERWRRRLSDEALAAPGAETWDGQWANLRAAPELRTAFAERDRRFGPRAAGDGTTLGELAGSLRAAGFTEVAVLKQIANRRLLVAIR